MPNAYQDPIFGISSSVVPLSLFWLVVIGAVVWFERSQALASTTLLWALFPIWLLAAMNLGHCVVRIQWASRTFRRHLPGLAARMIPLFSKMARARTERMKIATHLGLSALVLIVCVRLGVQGPLPFCIFFVSVALVASLRIILPPAAIYLSSSAPVRLQLMQQLQARVIPGVTGLLDVTQNIDTTDGVKTFFFKATIMLFDSRTNADDDWKVVAAELMDIVPLVFLDARETSPGVLYEVERIFREKLAYKTMFVSEENGQCPALESLNTDARFPEEEVCRLSESHLLANVHQFVRAARTHWIPNLKTYA